MRIFVDTGAWIAIADRNDQYAKIASQFYTDLIHQRRNLITSDLILVETFNLLSRTIGSKTTVKFGNVLKTHPFLIIEPITRLDWERGMSILSSMGLMCFHNNVFSHSINKKAGLLKWQ